MGLRQVGLRQVDDDVAGILIELCPGDGSGDGITQGADRERIGARVLCQVEFDLALALRGALHSAGRAVESAPRRLNRCPSLEIELGVDEWLGDNHCG